MKQKIKRLGLLLLLLTAILTAHADILTSLNENFDTSTSIPAGWTQSQVAGNKAWYVPSYNGNNFAAMTGFKGKGPFDQWLISPAIDMSKVIKKVLSFDTQVNRYGSTQSALKVFVLTTADPATAKATQLNANLATAPASGYSDWANSGELDLSAFSGIIYIGFEYTSPVADNYATWCVDNVKLNPGGIEMSGFVYNNMRFEIFENSDSCYVVGGGTPDLVVPATAINPVDNKSYKVTAIGSAAFKGTLLKSITIPEGVTSIWSDAFNGCQSLTTVKMPQSLKYLGERAFYDCSMLDDIALGKIRSCRSEAFSRCGNLTAIDLVGMTSIGREAFSDCSGLKSVVLGNVTSWGSYAFSGCTSLTSVDLGNTESIGDYTFRGCTGLKYIDLKKVTTVGEYAFDGCNGLVNIDFSSVKTLGRQAFSNCSGLTSIDLKNMGEIGRAAFYGCTGLTHIDLKKVTTLGCFAFSGCTGLKNVKFGKVDTWNTTYESAYSDYVNSAFINCTGLETVDLGETTILGNYLFSGCTALKDIDLKNVTELGNGAFRGCTGLTELDLNKFAQLGTNSFKGCSGLKSLSILKASKLDASTFNGCDAIETLVLPYEWGADFKMNLSGTTQLRTLYIGENTTSIPNKTFVNNKNLFEVYSNAATPPSIGTATFGSETYSYATLYVPQGNVDAYKTATGWSKFEDIQELPFQIVVKDKKVSVDRTKSILVSASVTPAAATSSLVKWYSLDDEVATVTTDGVVTGMAEGGVTLLAYCDGITAPMKVIVKKFDGVEDVMADDPTEMSEFDVYNLQGIRVRTDCTKEQLSELSHGIYILVSPQGRKKVII